MTDQDPKLEAALAAMDRGDAEALAALLDSRPELVEARVIADEPPYDGYFWRPTLLHHVAGNPIRGELPENVVEIAAVLLDAGADVDATCGGGPSQPETAGATTLGLLVSGAQAQVRGLTEPLLDLLLDAGAALDPAGDGGAMWIALFHTVENPGQGEAARMLYDRGHEVDLCYAAGLGLSDIVESCFGDDGTLAPGADRFYRHHRRSGPEAPDGEIVQDALLFAAVGGRLETAELLLAKGADVNAARPWGPELPTPLHGAAWAGWPEMARLLVDRGADVGIRDANHGSTPIGWASFCDRREVLDVLLEDESKVDLLDAFELRRVDLFAKILGDGDPDRDVGPGGRGVLLRAAAHRGDVEMVELLLARGADPGLANPDGKTALDWALREGHDAVAEILRRHGARPSPP